MAKSDLESLKKEAEEWLLIVNHIQSCAEAENWDELTEWQRKRDESVSRYQQIAASFDFSQWPAASLLPLQEIIHAIQQKEEALITRFQEYQQQLGDSLKSVQMEGTLRNRYGLDEA